MLEDWDFGSICKHFLSGCINTNVFFNTPGIRPNASGAATVSPDGKQVGMDFITNYIIT